MLIGNSLPEHLFIRVAVPALRLITPCALLSCVLVPTVRPQLLSRHRWLWPVAVWFSAESLFYMAVYIPLSFALQKPVKHPATPPKDERQQLYDRILENLPNPEYYLSRWFLDAPPQDIKRENVKEFYAWSLLNKRYEDVDSLEEIELDVYIDQLEQKLGRSLEPGTGTARPLRTTLDPVPMQHRPLIWYLIVFVVESGSSLNLFYHGFSFYSSWNLKSLTTFPLRLHSVTSRSSTAIDISYWYREHTSKSQAPILFIHGIGIGAYTHVSFLNELASTSPGQGVDRVGVIAVELSAISSRLCASTPSASEVKDQINAILDHHGWDEVVLVGHSYGTSVASTMLRDRTSAKRIKATVLMDPICFMLHLPDVAFNFTRRLPRRANERMLYYFASQDMMISYMLARRFFWNQLILFKEDLPPDMPLTVSLSGQDLIVPTREVWSYLTGNEAPGHSDQEWEQGRLRVHWFSNLDHAGIFAARGLRRGVGREIREYC